MDISQSFQNALDDIIAFLPRALAFLAILIIGWFIAKWIGKLVGKLLARVGLDKVGAKSGLRRFTGKFELSDLLGKLVYFALVLFTLQLAFGAFGPNPVSELLTAFVSWLPQLFVAVLLVVVALAVANAVFELISGTLSETGYGRTVARAVQVAIVFVGAVAALEQAGIAATVTTSLLWAVLAAVAGVIIVGVGGGLIGPMRQRWERMLGTAEGEAAKLKESQAGASADPMARSYTSERFGSGADLQAETEAERRAHPTEP